MNISRFFLPLAYFLLFQYLALCSGNFFLYETHEDAREVIHVDIGTTLPCVWYRSSFIRIHFLPSSERGLLILVDLYVLWRHRRRRRRYYYYYDRHQLLAVCFLFIYQSLIFLCVGPRY